MAEARQRDGKSPGGYERLRAEQTLTELPFRSGVPVLGPIISWFWERWNNVSTKWYARPLIEQQNRFNALVVDQLVHQDAQVADFASRIAACEARLEDLWTRLRDHDAWLIEQDREQSGYVRDLAEVTLQLIQLRREIQEMGDRPVRTVLAEP